MTDRPSDTTRPDHDPGHQQQQQQLSSSHSASSAPSQANNNKAGQSQPPSQRPSTVTSTGQMSFRRQRASRACEVCPIFPSGRIAIEILDFVPRYLELPAPASTPPPRSRLHNLPRHTIKQRTHISTVDIY
ncbi:hypothetical protein VTN31DRAFT_4240 [Thermomyces dupontii]|uniref:uncharacterized protein n=1 Tax=Talaromyces thermophilus TaxID=28565 RepID=UPI003743775B